MIRSILINTICPFLFVYGKKRGGEAYQEKAFLLLEQATPESNAILKKWQELGMENESAFASQSLLQLHSKYCNYKKCLSCSIGNQLIRE